MKWIIDHATIREEGYQVKVKFEDVCLWHETMTFDVAPSQEVSSLKVRAAKKTGHWIFASKLLLSNGTDQLGYSLNELPSNKPQCLMN